MKIKRLEQLVIMGGDALPGQPSLPQMPHYGGKRLPHLRIVTPEGEDDGRPPPLPDTMGLIVQEQIRRGVRTQGL